MTSVICLLCEEPVTKLDRLRRRLDMRGKNVEHTPWHDSVHIECEVRSIIGSVGHQQGTCFCFGGDREDPEGMSRREAAWAAYNLFHKETSKRCLQQWEEHNEKLKHEGIMKSLIDTR